MRILVSENFNPDTAGMIVNKGEGLMGRVAQTKKPLTVIDYSHWSGRMASYENQRLYSGLAVPMLAGSGELMGVLTVGYIHREHKFNENDIRLSNLFAQQATGRAQRQAFRRGRRRAEEAETIRKAGAVVVSTLNQEKAIDLILEQLAQVVPYDSASVLLYKKGALQIVGGHGFKDFQPILGLEISLDRSNPGAVVFLDNEPGMLTNIPEEAPQFNQVSQNNHIIHSWLGVPLKIQNHPIGILSLDGHKAGPSTRSMSAW